MTCRLFQDMKIDQSHDQIGPGFRKLPVGGDLSEVIKTTTAPLRNPGLLNQTGVLNFHFILRDIPPLSHKLRSEQGDGESLCCKSRQFLNLTFPKGRSTSRLRSTGGVRRWSWMHSCFCGAWSVNKQRVSVDRIIDYVSFCQMNASLNIFIEKQNQILNISSHGLWFSK